MCGSPYCGFVGKRGPGRGRSQGRFRVGLFGRFWQVLGHGASVQLSTPWLRGALGQEDSVWEGGSLVKGVMRVWTQDCLLCMFAISGDYEPWQGQPFLICRAWR